MRRIDGAWLGRGDFGGVTVCIGIRVAITGSCGEGDTCCSGACEKSLGFVGMPKALAADGERILIVNAVDHIADFVIAEELAACFEDAIPEVIVVGSEAHGALLVVAGLSGRCWRASRHLSEATCYRPNFR